MWQDGVVSGTKHAHNIMTKTPDFLATVKGITRTYEILHWNGVFAAKRNGFKPVLFPSKELAVKYAELNSGKPGK